MTEDLDRLLPPIAQLRDVLAVKEERSATTGGRVFVLSVELWNIGVVWHTTQAPHPEALIGHFGFRMEDDLGTDYGVPAGPAGGGVGYTHQVGSVFKVPVPDEAKEIRLTSGLLPSGEEVIVPLP